MLSRGEFPHRVLGNKPLSPTCLYGIDLPASCPSPQCRLINFNTPQVWTSINPCWQKTSFLASTRPGLLEDWIRASSKRNTLGMSSQVTPGVYKVCIKFGKIPLVAKGVRKFIGTYVIILLSSYRFRKLNFVPELSFDLF